MKTIADYKREIRMKQGLKKDPVSAISEMLGNQGGFGKTFADALGEAMQKAAEQAIKELLTNETLLLAIAQEAANRVRTPKDGKEGAKGEQGMRGFQGEKGEQGEKGFDGIDGYTPVKGVDYFTPTELDAICEKATELFTGDKIVKEINALPIEEKFQIDAKHIKNLPKKDVREGAGILRGGLKMRYNVELEGTINGVNTIFTIPASQPSPKDNKYIISARGVLKDADSGDFTISNSNRTITFTNPPPTGSARPRIAIYEAH